MSEIYVTPAEVRILDVTSSSQNQANVVEIEQSIIEVVTEGKQGPPGVAGSLGLVTDVDTESVVDGSLLYYDGGTSTFRADPTVTKLTITDGGNF